MLPQCCSPTLEPFAVEVHWPLQPPAATVAAPADAFKPLGLGPLHRLFLSWIILTCISMSATVVCEEYAWQLCLFLFCCVGLVLSFAFAIAFSWRGGSRRCRLARRCCCCCCTCLFPSSLFLSLSFSPSPFPSSPCRASPFLSACPSRFCWILDPSGLDSLELADWRLAMSKHGLWMQYFRPNARFQ